MTHPYMILSCGGIVSALRSDLASSTAADSAIFSARSVTSLGSSEAGLSSRSIISKTSKIENKGYTGQSLHFLIVNNNNFNGSIPSTLNLVPTLEALCLDRNKLTGPVPPILNSLASIKELYLSNNMLSGPCQT
ncbi:polygalacturonase inhibitor-like [Dioscorea cayenensis subsp. rotundata]|uniref:Polygalacturonase inhibitor-like n=1 Tax=Dioscorea cayennensis subsp. rotundata TaxID=55577 RepID=A0AB40B277_DIOCR|nr:polygalacturonase inhibitor-like [Dioscorea cayenensis subsp. rotundata]